MWGRIVRSMNKGIVEKRLKARENSNGKPRRREVSAPGAGPGIRGLALLGKVV